MYKAATYKAITRPVMACPECGVTARMQIDHIVKPRDGGGNEASNLRYLCGPCNSKRGNQ